MSPDRPGQHGVEESTPGRFGLNTQHDGDMGSSLGDAVDSTYSANPVDNVGFQRVRNMQGTGTTFFYPYGKNSQQQY